MLLQAAVNQIRGSMLIEDGCFCTDNFLENLAALSMTACETTVLAVIVVDLADDTFAACPELLAQATPETLIALGLAEVPWPFQVPVPAPLPEPVPGPWPVVMEQVYSPETGNSADITEP